MKRKPFHQKEELKCDTKLEEIYDIESDVDEVYQIQNNQPKKRKSNPTKKLSNPNKSSLLLIRNQDDQVKNNLSLDISQNLEEHTEINSSINDNSSNFVQNTNLAFQDKINASIDPNNLKDSTENSKSGPSKGNSYLFNNVISIPLHPSVKVPHYYTFSYFGTQVKFPYENPYEAQKVLISNSLLAFSKSQNALLESPTGTGKSLALLSSSLAFLEKNPQVMRVFYTSRTHIQLQQLVGEFKKLPYFPRFSILASRRHLCIVPEVARSNSPDYECKKLCDTSGCPYNKTINLIPNSSNSSNNAAFIDIEDIKISSTILGSNSSKSSVPVPFEFTNQGQNPKFDLDDLKNYGKRHKVCPYQLSRNIYQNSQLVFCPYNYVLTPNDDKSLLSDLVKNSSIVIFDEGHNIESTARDDSSISVSYRLAFEARKSAQNAPQNSVHKQFFEQIQLVATDIINFIKAKKDEYKELIRKNSNNGNFKKPKYLQGDSIPNVFIKLNENKIQLNYIGLQMHNWLQYINNKGPNEKNSYINEVLISFCLVCSDVFRILSRSSYDSFKIAFVPDENGRKEKDEFRLLCMRPAFLFDRVNKNARSIIIASGTLSPLNSFASELEASFPIRVSAPHVVDPSQVLSISINSYKNCRITSKFSVLQSHNQEIYSSLSQIILKTIQTVPGGALLFTPSYYTKDSIIRRWKATNMYDSICKIKPIVEEKSELPAKVIIDEFVSYPDGALLIGVCRGKISEGLDFADDLARIVYVFGIPYPGFKDPEVELKMNYNDYRHRINKNYLNGSDWYTGQAFRALFQSVGRCLRHTSDYGAIVFLDERIQSNLDKLPTWLKMKESLHNSLSVEQAHDVLSDFYKKMKEKFPNSNSSYSSLTRNELCSFSDVPGDFEQDDKKSSSISYSSFYNQFENQGNGAEDVISVTFKSASEMYRKDYIKIDLNDDFSNKMADSRKEVFVQGEEEERDDDNFNNIDDDDYDDFGRKKDQNQFLTNLFCVSCGAPVIRIKNLDNADFKKISTPEFFQILDLKEDQTPVLYIMKNDIQTDFTKSTKISKWSSTDSCILNRKECQKCGSPIAAYVVSTRSESQFKKGEFLFITDMLSMKLEGKITPLREIASA